MGALNFYKSPEGVIYILSGYIRGATYLTNMDGTYDEKAKQLADSFNRGEYSVTINGITFKMPTSEEKDKMKKDEKSYKNQKTSFWRKLFGY